MKYVVYYDDGTMLAKGPTTVTPWIKVKEYPNAEKFTNKRKAEEAAKKINYPFTVEPVE